MALETIAGLSEDNGPMPLFFTRPGHAATMPSNVFPLPSDLLQPHPGLGILRLAALSAEGQGNLDRRMMTLCACDWRGIADRAGQAYAKAAVLETALSACADLDEDLTAAEIGAADPLDALRIARAEAIAEALRSERWSS